MAGFTLSILAMEDRSIEVGIRVERDVFVVDIGSDVFVIDVDIGVSVDDELCYLCLCCGH